LFRIAEASHVVKEGINQVLFVTGGRFTEQEIMVYELLRRAIFDENIVNYTTIIRTNFSDFENEETCEEDRKLIKRENKIDGISNMNIIYLDNPLLNGSPRIIELAKKIREESRKTLLNYLENINQSFYKPNNLDDLNKRTANVMTENEKVKKELEEAKKEKELMEERLKQEKLSSEKQMEYLREEISKKEQALQEYNNF
jgi:hypothetical protein